VPRERELAGLVFGALLLQMVIGEIQWRTHLPWGLVLVHVALGTAVWAGVIAIAARLLLRSEPRLP
jgi:heme A synthase